MFAKAFISAFESDLCSQFGRSSAPRAQVAPYKSRDGSQWAHLLICMNDYVQRQDPEQKYQWYNFDDMYKHCLILAENWSHVAMDTNGFMYYQTDRKVQREVGNNCNGSC